MKKYVRSRQDGSVQMNKRPPEEIAKDEHGERGTALGSEISQLLQLAVPNHIDHAIKEKLRIRYYIRFNDDLLIISDNKDQLKAVRQYIVDEYAKNRAYGYIQANEWQAVTGY